MQYTFPLSDVQPLVFTGSTDVISLRSRKVDSGQDTGRKVVAFTDNQGIGYLFPLKDVASIVFSRTSISSSPQRCAELHQFRRA